MPKSDHRAVYAHRTLKGTASMTTNITEQHRYAFDALTRGEHDDFALFSVFVNNQPAAAIVAVPAHGSKDEGSETEFHIKPLLVSIFDGLVPTAHDGREA